MASLVSPSCQHGVPRARGLRPQALILSVPEAGTPESRCHMQAGSLPRLHGEPLPRVSPSGSWKHLPSSLSPHVHVVFSLSARLCIRISPFHKDTRHTGLAPTLMTSFLLSKDPVSK